MKNSKALLSLLLVALLVFCSIGCSSNDAPVADATPVQSESTPDAGESTPDVGADTEPKVLKVAFVVADTVESIYNRTMMLSLNLLEQAGEPFELNYIENVTSDTVESVLRTYAESDYDIIIAHAGICRDAVIKIHADYPEVIFLGSGNDWETPGPNVGAYDQALHEGCYVQGVIAGLMTKSNVIGFVGGMPTANVTSEVNAFIRGAKSVNPDIDVQVSYIESWYDPVKAKECTNTQISMGADIVFGERDGVIQACQEAGIYAMCEKLDQSEIAPDTVIAQSIIRWDSTLKEIFDLVREGKFEPRYYTSYEGAMQLGICEVLMNTSVIPQDVQDAANEVIAQLTAGELSVPFEP